MVNLLWQPIEEEPFHWLLEWHLAAEGHEKGAAGS